MNDEIIGSTFDKAELQTVFENAFEAISSMKAGFSAMHGDARWKGKCAFYQRKYRCYVKTGAENDHKGKL